MYRPNCYTDVSIEYTGVNRHSSDTRIGLMDSTVPIEAMLGIPQD